MGFFSLQLFDFNEVKSNGIKFTLVSACVCVGVLNVCTFRTKKKEKLTII